MHIVCLTFDFDGLSGFISRGQVGPSWISRGEFGPRVGAPWRGPLLRELLGRDPFGRDEPASGESTSPFLIRSTSQSGSGSPSGPSTTSYAGAGGAACAAPFVPALVLAVPLVAAGADDSSGPDPVVSRILLINVAFATRALAVMPNACAIASN